MSLSTTGRPRYAIIDEPHPGALARFAMPPVIPLIALMLFSPLGVVLFVINSFALGGRTKWREVVMAGIAFLAKDVLRVTMALFWPAAPAWQVALDYAFIFPIVLGLWFGFKVYMLQSPTYQIHQFLKQQRGTA